MHLAPGDAAGAHVAGAHQALSRHELTDTATHSIEVDAAPMYALKGISNLGQAHVRLAIALAAENDVENLALLGSHFTHANRAKRFGRGIERAHSATPWPAAATALTVPGACVSM